MLFQNGINKIENGVLQEKLSVKRVIRWGIPRSWLVKNFLYSYVIVTKCKTVLNKIFCRYTKCVMCYYILFTIVYFNYNGRPCDNLQGLMLVNNLHLYTDEP